jgi:hypothetical protein
MTHPRVTSDGLFCRHPPGRVLFVMTNRFNSCPGSVRTDGRGAPPTGRGNLRRSLLVMRKRLPEGREGIEPPSYGKRVFVRTKE